MPDFRRKNAGEYPVHIELPYAYRPTNRAMSHDRIHYNTDPPVVGARDGTTENTSIRIQVT